MDTTKQPGIQISQVILLGARFAHRDDVFSLLPTTRVENLPIKIEVKVAGKVGDPGSVIRLRAFTEENPEALYRIDVEVAALIERVSGEENLDPFEYARDMGPVAFFPFLREAIANVTMRGRFGPVWLKPYNFVAAPPTVEVGSKPD